MNNHTLTQKLESVERLANAGKVTRLLNNPFKYAFAIFYKNFLYKYMPKEKAVICNLFYGKKMKVLLPASTDIYLTGGKSHPSEVRLARFLINNLVAGDIFWDIGAHYGYFSLLAAELVGIKGQIISFEPSTSSYAILAENAHNIAQVSVFNKAVSKDKGALTFYEFPNLYSEYNSLDITQFEHEKWFKKSPPKQTTVPTESLDLLYAQYKSAPKIIKIDVEGAENLVITGGQQMLTASKPIIIMEFLASDRQNGTHKEAAAMLQGHGYMANIILADGTLQEVKDIDAYLEQVQLESDNIVFQKP
ncbi:FkbM family methyltransferase [Edaphocola flava]|uniref:FkbM family methyltransferase n=1 Tax=Edaphocola flava TaxID=2499629 RepID=UPI00100AC0DD|nr:FkbM family methyltransferase [Edaphocola flava]